MKDVFDVARRRWLTWAVAGQVLFAPLAWAQSGASAGPVVPASEVAASPELGVSEWLLRLHSASRGLAYIGTFVVSAGDTMSSARIWHVCDGESQMERVESLSGEPRSTFRRDDQVITFLPESKLALSEKRESLGRFPDLLTAVDSPIGQFYAARSVGTERVAGFDADVVLLTPRDEARFGYRIWSEKKSGLVVKLQILDVDGHLLEQAAFSELQMDAPVNAIKIAKMMENTDGYQVRKAELVKTTAAAQGWTLKSTVAGFLPTSCYVRPSPASRGSRSSGSMQWVFSDGLASISLFVEPVDKRRHALEGVTSMGATNTLTRRLRDKAGDWWLTVIGEVPLRTLNAFSLGLERRR